MPERPSHPLRLASCLHPLGTSAQGRLLKRAMDVSVSLSGLLALSPLLLLIAAVIKLTSRGPVIYRQKRVGLGGSEFTMLKFRTMRKDAEAETGPVWAKANDERCTAVGRFLRRYNLDELPQFANVLAGQMSLVGPRPERPTLVRRFKERIERYAHRHWVKPGLTGLAQINGFVGNTSLEERIRLDIRYMENWSIWLDLRILLVTPFAILGNSRPRAEDEKDGAAASPEPGPEGATHAHSS